MPERAAAAGGTRPPAMTRAARTSVCTKKRPRPAADEEDTARAWMAKHFPRVTKLPAGSATWAHARHRCLALLANLSFVVCSAEDPDGSMEFVTHHVVPSDMPMSKVLQPGVADMRFATHFGRSAYGGVGADDRFAPEPAEAMLMAGESDTVLRAYSCGAFVSADSVVPVCDDPDTGTSCYKRWAGDGGDSGDEPVAERTCDEVLCMGLLDSDCTHFFADRLDETAWAEIDLQARFDDERAGTCDASNIDFEEDEDHRWVWREGMLVERGCVNMTASDYEAAKLGSCVEVQDDDLEGDCETEDEDGAKIPMVRGPVSLEHGAPKHELFNVRAFAPERFVSDYTLALHRESHNDPSVGIDTHDFSGDYPVHWHTELAASDDGAVDE